MARARAKRELGQSGHSHNHESRRESAADRSPATTTIRKLDHGRGLALEDLASPTHYGFGPEEALTEGGRRQNMDEVSMGNHYPLSAAATDLAQLNIVTETEDRFMELAGSLGEGQGTSTTNYECPGFAFLVFLVTFSSANTP